MAKVLNTTVTVLLILIWCLCRSQERRGGRGGGELIRFNDLKRDLKRPASQGKCIFTINSNKTKQGTIKSPGYPRGYTPGITCNYNLKGRSCERIQLVFRDIHLREGDNDDLDKLMVVTSVAKNTKKARKQSTGLATGPDDISDKSTLPTSPDVKTNSVTSNFPDSTEIAFLYHLLDEEKYLVLGLYSGRAKPRAMMSAGRHVTITMVTKMSAVEADETSAAGFLLDFKFVSNFGINEGEQLSKDCIFLFNSTMRSQGTFHSPNYPGLYPRSTDCYFLFKRSQDELLTIKFTHLDVDGIPPLCSNESESDFLEIFSRFHKLRIRLCTSHPETRITDSSRTYRFGPKVNERPEPKGQIKEDHDHPSVSEEPGEDVVSVGFHSNSKYQAEGFMAEYRFDKSIGRITSSLHSLVTITTTFPLFLFLVPTKI